MLKLLASDGSPTQSEEMVPVPDEGSSSGVGDGPSSGVASEECDGGPVDKSVLKTFKDRIAYAVWHQKVVFYNFFVLTFSYDAIIKIYLTFNCD